MTSAPALPAKETAPRRPLLRGLGESGLAAWLEARGEPAFRARQILDWLHHKAADMPEACTNLPAPLRAALAEEFDWSLPAVGLERKSRDGTRKLLLRLRDGRLVETVLIPASPALYGAPSDRLTLCVSTQVGCAYGCRFCASGLMGFTRNLDAGEIVSQVELARRLAGRRVDNLVFMGMGEPLANYDNLMRAARILNAPWGLGIGARHMTISTSGLAPRIRDLAAEPLQIRLAVSLHGATDEVRGQIMPVNKRYPVAELMDACREFRAKRKQAITFEFILIAGLNDTADQAERLARLARPLRAKVNLIPYNTVEGLDWRRPSPAAQKAFLEILKARGIAATLRREKGHDIEAACGQLRLKRETEEMAASSAGK